MATVDELLAGVSTVDKTLVISNDFRTINIPSSVPNLGVEYDDDVLRLDFKMPRYVSDTDLSEFAIRINYINAQRETDVYTVSDTKIYNDYITFSWLVGPTATRYKGDTKFIVCAKTITSDGIVDREFNTTIASLPVLEGLEVDESIVTEYSDIIEQWRQELFGIGDTEEASIKAVSQNEQAAIENKGAEVLATIPDDYRTAVNMTDNAERSKADAIVCSVEGETIRVEDSSDDYLRGFKLFGKTTQVATTGKNLLDLSEMEFDDSHYTHMFGPDSAAASSLYEFLKTNTGRTIVTSMTTTGTISGITIGSMRFYGEDNVLICALAPNVAHVVLDNLPDTFKAFYVYGSSTGASVKNIQIEYGETPTAYEPYSGGTASPNPDYPQELISIDNPTINIYNKNLWSIDHIELTGGSRNDVLFEGRVPLPVTMSWIQDFSRTTGSALFGYEVDGETYFSASAENPGPFQHVINKGKYLEKITLLNWAPETGNLTNIQLEVGSVATVYESHEPVQSITLPYNLHGIMIRSGGFYNRIDTDGNKWICDEIDFNRGIYIQRVKELVCTGEENWIVSEMYPAYSLMLEHTAATGLCTHMNRLSVTELKKGVQGVYLEWSGYALVQLKEYFPTLSDFQAFLAEQYANGTPVIFRYAFEVPVITPLSAKEIEWFRFAHTNFPTTTILNDAGATMELEYNADTRLWLDNIPKVTDEQAGPLVEAWMDEHFTDAEGVVYGKSAYEIAVERGFQGSEEYWLASLRGKPGADGYIPVKGLDYFTQSDKDEIVSRITPVQIITWEDDD